MFTGRFKICEFRVHWFVVYDALRQTPNHKDFGTKMQTKSTQRFHSVPRRQTMSFSVIFRFGIICWNFNDVDYWSDWKWSQCVIKINRTVSYSHANCQWLHCDDMLAASILLSPFFLQLNWKCGSKLSRSLSHDFTPKRCPAAILLWLFTPRTCIHH